MIYHEIAAQIKESVLADPAVKWYQREYNKDDFPIYTNKTGGKKLKPKSPHKWISKENFDMLFGYKALEDYGVQIILNIYTRLTDTRYPLTYSKESCFLCVTWLKEHSAIMRSIFPEDPEYKRGEGYGDIDDLEDRINAAGVYITDSPLIDVMHI